ncbi:MAG: ADP-forming succinate--CoA ligase subunit beta [Bacteroidota bacterium]|nr:ADP-forming succinate--CoA ligase subunit beta [Bacteroidota bacterium]
MNIHEYQGISILKKNNVRIAEGFVAETSEEAVKAADKLQSEFGSDKFVVKAQIHAGGRGKGGGVKIAKSIDEVAGIANDILGMRLVTKQTGSEGKEVKKVLISQNVYYPGKSEAKEYYMGILLDRDKGRHVLMYSPEGGVDIETVAEKTPQYIFREYIDPCLGLQAYQMRRIAFNLGLEGDAFKDMLSFVKGLYDSFINSDAQLLEINPVLKTSDNKILAVDCKFSIDDSALFRHKDIMEMRDLSEEDPAEVEAGRYKLNFVKLDGNVGCMVNGAGLAMATMDLIKLSGGSPANFLDVGGTASAETVEAGFRIILKDPNVKAILINIFGGIVRCDRVANGVVDACKSFGSLPVPLIVRLQGTNAEEAKELIDNSGFKVFSAISFEDAAKRIKEVIS